MAGAKDRTYRLTALDVGTRVSVEVRVRTEGHAWTSALSRPTATVDYRTLVLAEASILPSFGAVCSTFWSCRVGRFVVINQDRWKFASPAWNRERAGLRDYRHLVVTHETGYWLGHGHPGCPGAGQPAPVMMQQLKGLDGCRFNPWPRPDEL